MGRRALIVPEFAAFDPAPARRMPPLAALVVRDAFPGDLDAAAQLAATREGTDAAPYRSAFERAAAADDQELLVAVAAERVVGYGRSGWLAAPGLPEGWYLTGLVVAPDCRRRGVGLALTRARLERGLARAPRVFYFATTINAATIALHAQLGFHELARGITAPGTSFTGGIGALFECTRADVRR